MKLNQLSVMVMIVMGLIALALVLISLITKALSYLFGGIGVCAALIWFSWWVLGHEFKDRE